MRADNRVSTKEQTQNLSLPTQRKACEEYCLREGLEVVRVFMEEGESAKTADRTELKKLLEFCRLNKKRVRVVVVHSLSRFSRDAATHHALRGMLRGLGIGLRSVTEPIDDSPAGKFMESLFSSVAQFDNDMKAERTRAGMRAAQDRGRWTFQAPIGYLTGPSGGPSLVADPTRAALIRLAFERFDTEACSKRELLDFISARGLKTRRGRTLSAQTLNSILRNPLYAGRIVVPKFGAGVVRGDFEPLLSDGLFDRVQARLAGRSTTAITHARKHPDFPLRRIVRCESCGRPLTGSWSSSRTVKYAYYHCPTVGHVRGTKATVEDAFRALLDRLRPQNDYLRLFDAVVLDVFKERQASSKRARTVLQAHITSLRSRLDELDEAFLFGKRVDQATYERQRDRLREQVALAEIDLADATAEELDVEGLLAFARHVLTNASRLWDNATLDQKLRLQGALFPEGLRFDGSGFGTPVTCLAFVESLVSDGSSDAVASPTGFEPVSPP